MYYLEPTILQVFIYFLFNNEKFNLSILPDHWKELLINRIRYDYGLDDIFFFTVNRKILLSNHNYECLKYVYDICASIGKSEDQTVISVQDIIKIIIDEPGKEELKISDLIHIPNCPVRNCIRIYKVVDIGILESERKRFEDFIYNKYLENYKKGKLKPRDLIVPNDLDTTLRKLDEILKLYYKLPQPVKIRISNSYFPLKKELRFYELLLYMERENIIEINGWNFKKDKPKDSNSGLENGLNIKLTFKKEIKSTDKLLTEKAIKNKNQNTPHIAKKLDYDDFTGEIFIMKFVDGILIEKKTLKTIHSKLYKVVFGYCFKNPDNEVPIEKLIEMAKKEKIKCKSLKNNLRKIAQELNFTGDNKKFFITTGKTARLRKEISEI